MLWWQIHRNCYTAKPKLIHRQQPNNTANSAPSTQQHQQTSLEKEQKAQLELYANYPDSLGFLAAQRVEKPVSHGQDVSAGSSASSKTSAPSASSKIPQSQQELVGSSQQEPLYDQGAALNGHQSDRVNVPPELRAEGKFKPDPAASPPVDPHVDDDGEAVSAAKKTGGDGR
eukprot:GHVS01041651.1.p1 GENE.GHVS01041651.1~~GHVS01041651.1.p1  ORF type:complete len:172 (+),score=33.91 GHVS01041651.1:202-717(+)